MFVKRQIYKMMGNPLRIIQTEKREVLSGINSLFSILYPPSDYHFFFVHDVNIVISLSFNVKRRNPRKREIHLILQNSYERILSSYYRNI